MNNLLKKLALGTVQFGVPYGISNKNGQPNKQQVLEILKCAHNIGIRLLDTAPAYGESEKLLGELKDHFQHDPFLLISKLIKTDHANLSKKTIDQIRRGFFESLTKLNQESIEGVLIHAPEALKKEGSDLLIALLIELKEAKYIKKLGVSIYDMEEAEYIINSMPCDIIQLPFNLLDQRATQQNILTRLKKNHIEIHVRSVFLQGLLLMAHSTIPTYLQPLISSLNYIQNLTIENNISMQQCAIQFVAYHQEVDYILIGINEISELEKIILHSNENIPLALINKIKEIKIPNQTLIDPRTWKK